MYKYLALRPLIILVSLCVSLVLAELLARAFYAPPVLDVPAGSRFIANQAATPAYLLRRDYRTPYYSINTCGYEGPELPRAAAADSIILLIGDSVLFPETQRDSESIAGRLRQRIKSHIVIDGAVPGYNLFDYLARARSTYDLLPYRTVILFVGDNDMSPSYLEPFGNGLRIAQELWNNDEARQFSGLRSLRVSILQRHSVLYRLIVDSYYRLLDADASTVSTSRAMDSAAVDSTARRNIAPESPDVSREWGAYLETRWLTQDSWWQKDGLVALRDFCRWAKERDIDVIVLLIPNMSTLLQQEPVRVAADAITRAKREHPADFSEIRLLELSTLFRPGQHAPECIFTDFVHLTSEGARQVTDAALEALAPPRDRLEGDLPADSAGFRRLMIQVRPE